MKLEDLKDIAVTRGLLNLTTIAREVGIPINTLYSRMRRGGPELTEDEAKAIRRALLPIKQLMT